MAWTVLETDPGLCALDGLNILVSSASTSGNDLWLGFRIRRLSQTMKAASDICQVAFPELNVGDIFKLSVLWGNEKNLTLVIFEAFISS